MKKFICAGVLLASGSAFLPTMSAAAAAGDVVVGEHVVLRVRYPSAGLSVEQRAEAIQQRIFGFLGAVPFDAAQVRVQPHGKNYAVMIGSTLIVTTDPRTAAANGMTERQLADLWAANLARAIPLAKARTPDEAPAAYAPTLTGTHWKALSIGDRPARHPGEGQTEVHLELDASGNRVYGSGGVNRFHGSFTVTGDSLKFSPMARTLMAGPPELMKQEDALMSALEKTASYKITKETLRLFDSAGRELARFVAAPAPPAQRQGH
ncbi:MAG: hypothetical protein KatS3mg024_2447 [Armatimonadota bacterium]|nr:MAG: hypothetical protein KatS3mg024_2447 [Armatimonadota bacterium]